MGKDCKALKWFGVLELECFITIKQFKRKIKEMFS
ncbi:hypothetical protein ES707_21709 [subsurface metagenome]